MSWSVSASGKSDEVAKAIESQFASMSPLSEPEESIKHAFKAAILLALDGNIPAADRTVSAWGSQSVKHGIDGAPDEVSNTASITIS
jgi:hypothetical protein